MSAPKVGPQMSKGALRPPGWTCHGTQSNHPSSLASDGPTIAVTFSQACHSRSQMVLFYFFHSALICLQQNYLALALRHLWGFFIFTFLYFSFYFIILQTINRCLSLSNMVCFYSTHSEQGLLPNINVLTLDLLNYFFFLVTCIQNT